MEVKDVLESMRRTYDTPNALLRVLIVDFINSRGLAEDLGKYIRAREGGDYPDDILEQDVLA